MRSVLVGLLALVAPIPDPLPTTLPHFQGAPATARPMRATVAPQNPFLAHDPRSNIHNDTWMTDAYRQRGPLGRVAGRVLGHDGAGAVRLADVPLARATS